MTEVAMTDYECGYGDGWRDARAQRPPSDFVRPLALMPPPQTQQRESFADRIAWWKADDRWMNEDVYARPQPLDRIPPP